MQTTGSGFRDVWFSFGSSQAYHDPENSPWGASARLVFSLKKGMAFIPTKC